MKFNEAVRRFVGQYPNKFTRDAYLQTLNLLERYVGEQKDIAKITTVDLLEFTNDLQGSNYKYAPTTIHRHIKQTKIFFNWLVKMGFLSNNPATNIRNRAPAKNIDRNKAMSDEELDMILRYAYSDTIKYAIVLFLADTGCRAGGVATLQIDKLNLIERKAFVVEKGGRSRWVYFAEECENALIRWLKKREKIIQLSIERGYCAEDHGFVFCHDQGAYKPDAISQIICRLGKESGIEHPVGSHALRHRKGHQLADAGIAASIAANVLGHSDPSITLNYYYPKDDSRAEKAARELAYKSPQAPNMPTYNKIVQFKTS